MAETTLIQALVAAQSEMPNPPLDGFNPHYKSKFSTLLAVRDTVVPIFNKHGIWVSQGFAVTSEGAPVLTTTLRKGDQTILSSALIPPQSDIQKWAAAVTYMRRIALLSIAGVVGDPDADAEDVVRAVERPQAIPNHVIDNYVDQLRSYMNVGDAKGVYETHRELNGQEELYKAVGNKLDTHEKESLRKCVNAKGILKPTHNAEKDRMDF